MKQFFFTLFLMAGGILIAQPDCGSRYITPIFTQITTTADIVYGHNVSIGGVAQDLKLDFYEPDVDTLPLRPLIILLHGFPGDKSDPEMAHFSDRLAKRGFVVASINTTLPDIQLTSAGELAQVVIRSMHDYRAAIRFFKQDLATNNMYKVDTSRMIIGGYSYGAIIGKGVGYFEYAEFNSTFQSVLDTIPGGIEGTSGNPGYSTQIQGVINIAGQLTDLDALKGANSPFIVSIHGDADAVSPYVSGVTANGFVYGAGSIHPMADSLGIPNRLLTIPGGEHYTFYSDSIYRDSTEAVIAAFIHDQICDAATAISPDRLPAPFGLYPNPVKNILTIRSAGNSQKKVHITISNALGQIVYAISDRLQNSESPIDLTHLEPGIWLVQIQQGKHRMSKKIVKLD